MARKKKTPRTPKSPKQSKPNTQLRKSLRDKRSSVMLTYPSENDDIILGSKNNTLDTSNSSSTPLRAGVPINTRGTPNNISLFKELSEVGVLHDSHLCSFIEVDSDCTEAKEDIDSISTVTEIDSEKPQHAMMSLYILNNIFEIHNNYPGDLNELFNCVQNSLETGDTISEQVNEVLKHVIEVVIETTEPETDVESVHTEKDTTTNGESVQLANVTDANIVSVEIANATHVELVHNKATNTDESVQLANVRDANIVSVEIVDATNVESVHKATNTESVQPANVTDMNNISIIELISQNRRLQSDLHSAHELIEDLKSLIIYADEECKIEQRDKKKGSVIIKQMEEDLKRGNEKIACIEKKLEEKNKSAADIETEMKNNKKGYHEELEMKEKLLRKKEEQLIIMTRKSEQSEILQKENENLRTENTKIKNDNKLLKENKTQDHACSNNSDDDRDNDDECCCCETTVMNHLSLKTEFSKLKEFVTKEMEQLKALSYLQNTAAAPAPAAVPAPVSTHSLVLNVHSDDIDPIPVSTPSLVSNVDVSNVHPDDVSSVHPDDVSSVHPDDVQNIASTSTSTQPSNVPDDIASALTSTSTPSLSDVIPENKTPVVHPVEDTTTRIERVREYVRSREEEEDNMKRYRWEKASSGVPRKTMNKMGFRGGGIGRKEDGIIEALSAHNTRQTLEGESENDGKKTLMIFSDSMFKGVDKSRISEDLNVVMSCHGGCTAECMLSHVDAIGIQKPEYALIHVGTNNCTSCTSDEVIEKLNTIYKHIKEISPYTDVFFSLPITRNDNARADTILKNINVKMRMSRIPHIEHTNITHAHLAKKGLHLSNKGKDRLADNIATFLYGL